MEIITKSHLLEFRNNTRSTFKSINESLIEFSSESKEDKVTIFLSHKHNEIEELDSAISLLKSFRVSVYVDWLDDGMPEKTSGETALRIKEKIKENKKFVFLGTEGAIASKWCNWELGFGDSNRFIRDIAILPIRNSNYSSYSGFEYLQIYPTIQYLDGTETTVGGAPILKGYYVLDPPNESGNHNYVTLHSWLSR